MKYLVLGKLIEVEEDNEEIYGVPMYSNDKLPLIQSINGFQFRDERGIKGQPTKGEAIAAAQACGYKVFVNGKVVE